MKVKHYQELIVWQKAMNLAEEVTRYPKLSSRRDLRAYQPAQASCYFDPFECGRGTR